jgi:hypothetical protein
MFLMKKGVNYVLTGDNTSCQFKRNEFNVPAYTNAVAARFKVRLSLTKSGGDAALTAAQRRTLLEGFDLTLQYGYNGQHQPFSKVSWNKLRNLTRYGLGSEMEGFSDSATGLARTIASTATEVTFYLRVPFTALGWQDGQKTALWGVGPTQAKTMVFDFRRLAPTLPSGFALTGNVTLDIIPDVVPSKYDRWSYLPHYYELTETSRIAATMPPGFYALIFDRNAVHASNNYSDVGLTIDGLECYDKVDLDEVITRYRDPQAYFPAEADLSDEYTLIWAIPPGVLLQELPTGKPVFTQFTQNVTTMLLSLWYYPIIPDSAIEQDVKEASTLRGEQVHAIGAAEPLGYGSFPKSMRFALPFIIVSAKEREAEQYPALVAAPKSSQTAVYLPPTPLASAAVRKAVREKNGEPIAAEAEVQTLAITVPGAVQSTRGLTTGSRVLDTVRQTVLRAPKSTI